MKVAAAYTAAWTAGLRIRAGPRGYPVSERVFRDTESAVAGLRGEGLGVGQEVGHGIGVRIRGRKFRLGIRFGDGDRRGGRVPPHWFGRGGVDHHARGGGQLHFALAAIAASQALFAKVVIAGVLGATNADSGGFLSTDAAGERPGGLLFPS